MILERSFAVFAALLLFWSSSATAARNAWVIANGANGPVLQVAPKPDAQAVTSLQPGDPITISNYSTNGYFRARAASGQIGWVAVTSVGNAPPAPVAAVAPATTATTMTPTTMTPTTMVAAKPAPMITPTLAPLPAPVVTPVSSPPETAPPTADLDLPPLPKDLEDSPDTPPATPVAAAPVVAAPVARTPVVSRPAARTAPATRVVSAPVARPTAAAVPVAPAMPSAAPPAAPPVSYPYVDVQPTLKAQATEQPQQSEQSEPNDQSDQSEESETSQESNSTRLPYELKAFGGMQSLQTIIGFSEIGATLFSSMTYLGVQFGVPVTDRIFLLLRLEHLFNSMSADSYNFSMSSTPLMTGLSYSFLPSSSAVRLRGSLLMGVALSTTLDATATNDPAPNTTEAETQSFTEMLKADLEIPFQKRYAIYVEGGYRFLDGASVGPNSLTPNGSAIFEQGSSIVPIQLSLSGFFGGAGIAFYL